MGRPRAGVPRHGSEAGYHEENKYGQACERCTRGHRMYQRSASWAKNGTGQRFKRYDVIDHLWTPGRTTQAMRANFSEPASNSGEPADNFTEPTDNYAETPGNYGDTTSYSPQTPSNSGPTVGLLPPNSPKVSSEQPLHARIGAALADHVLGAGREDADSDVPGYLRDAARDTPKDTNLGEEWDLPAAEDVVLTAKDMRLIEENMGTYLSVVGMTLEIFDPYCGPILANNMGNIVKRWSKVVGRYPRAAKLFMMEGGGTIMDWIGALQATWPVLMAIYDHHLSHTISTEDGGVTRRVSGKFEGVSATMPPSPDSYEYTAQ